MREWRVRRKSAFIAIVFLAIVALARCIGTNSHAAETRVAALALPSGASADWQQWDSFLTVVIKKLGTELRPELRDQLAATFLDSRYQLVQTLSSGVSDPVPQLFQSSWNQLSPIVKQAIPGAAQQTASQYTSFITAMDAASALGGSLQRFGLFRITPDALRGAAGLLNTGNGDPLSYTMEVDSVLRDLLGLTSEAPPMRNPAEPEQKSRWEGLQRRAAAALKAMGPRSAHAAEADSDLDRLNQWVPEKPELQDYLIEVRRLITESSDRVLAKSSLGAENQQLYRQIVYTTGWQESCWRQFIKKGEKLTPLASQTGDVGLMQVNRITWRSLYNTKGLTEDIGYNTYAGAEILYHYLTRYAIPRKEDKQPNGNLARATYSAYNAGPSGLGRYRGVRQSAVWKKVDEAFWTKFKAISSGEELAVKGCYS